MDEKLAEFVGILLGDGCIKDYEKHKSIQISFNSNELQYINHVDVLIQEIFGVKPILKFRKSENTADLFLFKRNIISYLIKIGLNPSPKWNRATIPNCFLYKCDTFILRGLFDTDGCVTLTNNNQTLYPRLELKICPSPMQNQVIEIIKKYNFKFKVQNLDKGKIRIRLNGRKELEKWFKIVGFSNSKHLEKVKIIARGGFEFGGNSVFTEFPPPTSGSPEPVS